VSAALSISQSTVAAPGFDLGGGLERIIESVEG